MLVAAMEVKHQSLPPSDGVSILSSDNDTTHTSRHANLHAMSKGCGILTPCFIPWGGGGGGGVSWHSNHDDQQNTADRHPL